MAEQQKNSQVQQFPVEWTRIVSDQVGRVEAGLGELAKLESKTMAQAVSGLEESARYARESLAFAEKASAEWRKLVLDATRRAAAFFAPGA
ncbi:MAG TPA: hypothetical protein VEJ89_18335 [Myxococcaceae bacterium]|jgi:hypothetical protein|nr:hypothetical protein [Myxococcaceae bacterium]